MATKILAIGICCVVFLSGLFYTDHPAFAHFVKPEKEELCHICDVSVSKHPALAAVIMFEDGKHAKFHGAKCMFTYYQNIEKYTKQYRKKNVASLHGTDYQTLKHIKAEKAHYVINSTEKGPSGDELILFKDSASAEKYTKENGGKILSFNEITPEIIKSLKTIISDL